MRNMIQRNFATFSPVKEAVDVHIGHVISPAQGFGRVPS
mgnify:FL=1